MNHNEICIRLRRARAYAGMSQGELAKKSGIGIKTISSYECGRRIGTIKLDHLYCIVTACGMTLSEFLRDIETGKPSGIRSMSSEVRHPLV